MRAVVKSGLVYGAAGSIGTAATQLLVHHFGADVTAVCDTKDVELVRSLGARDVVDRLQNDFTENGESYAVVFDAVGKHSFRRCRRSLKPGGTYVTVDLGFGYHVPLLALVTRFVGGTTAFDSRGATPRPGGDQLRLPHTPAPTSVFHSRGPSAPRPTRLDACA